jgi:energy-coupling factor transport system ATP-binding protein
MEFVVNNFDRVIVMAHKNVIDDGDKRNVFWKKDVLTESKLKQPHMSSLADKLNLEEKILFTNELVENIENYK